MMQKRGVAYILTYQKSPPTPLRPLFFVQKNRRHLWYADDQVNSIDLLLGSTCQGCHRRPVRQYLQQLRQSGSLVIPLYRPRPLFM